MQLDIWECGNRHIHVNCDGAEIQFRDIEVFHKVISLCQEYIDYRRGKGTPIPEVFQDAFEDEV